jgi:hypothetical protein
MSNVKPSRAKLPSMADYIVRHDLPSLLAEARLDYNEASAGAPRHLNQKDISARFTMAPFKRPGKTPNE